MNHISEIIRQDILDIIKDGFIVYLEKPIYDRDIDKYVTEYNVKVPFYGRLDEISFLSRIYDLEKMPSKDSRFSNALGDINCHLRFGDYDNDCWFFYDDRFNLLSGNEDEPLLRFMCEMLHPAVRIEKSDWKLYLDKFNELLRFDGYELYPAQHISGRDLYKARTYIEPLQNCFPEDLFTERYKELIVYGHGEPIDNISNSVEFKAKKQICKIMLDFKEPMSVQPNRYDNLTLNTDVFEQAVLRLYEFLEFPTVDLTNSSFFDYEYLASCFTPFIFDLIELQYDELSVHEKKAFLTEINLSFEKNGYISKLVTCANLHT